MYYRLPISCAVIIRSCAEKTTHWRISCYTTATFHTFVFQQWRLNPCTPTFKSGYVTATARLHDHRRITCYPPVFRCHHLVLITSKRDSTSWQAVKCGLRKLGKFLHRSHSLLGIELRYGLKTSSGMVPFVVQARKYKLYTTTPGFKAVMRR